MKAVSVVSNPRLNTPPRSNYDEEYFVVEEVYYEDNCDDHNCDEDYYLIDNKPTTPNSKTGNNNTHSAISSLSQIKTNLPGKVATEDNRYYNVCAICMNTIEPAKKAQIDNCKHEFCCECIEAWSKTKLSCPLCTLTFNKLLVNFSADGKSHEEKNITIAPKAFLRVFLMIYNVLIMHIFCKKLIDYLLIQKLCKDNSHVNPNLDLRILGKVLNLMCYKI